MLRKTVYSTIYQEFGLTFAKCKFKNNFSLLLTQMTWKKEIDDPLNPDAWATMQKLSSSVSYFTVSTKMSKAGSFIYNS